MGNVGNLGNYQRLVQLAKAADGPVKLGLYVLGGGIAIGVTIGTAVAPAVKKGASDAFHAVTRRFKGSTAAASAIFTVIAEVDAYEIAMGLKLYAGDKFRVLESDGDVILIEVIGNSDNPFVVSGELLQSISDFRIETES